jgi:hypothetical protein
MSKLSSAKSPSQPRVNESGDAERVPSYGKRSGFASTSLVQYKMGLKGRWDSNTR